jgi:hypothetical protein
LTLALIFDLAQIDTIPGRSKLARSGGDITSCRALSFVPRYTGLSPSRFKDFCT